jgi:hypothetical protein
MTTKRAISIQQPWLEQILRGIKKKEYRTRPTRIRERVYLYASVTPADSPSGWRRVKEEPGQLPVGKIVGTIEVVDCRWNGRLERFEFALARPKRLKTPRTAKNQPNPVWWRPRFS